MDELNQLGLEAPEKKKKKTKAEKLNAMDIIPIT